MAMFEQYSKVFKADEHKKCTLYTKSYKYIMTANENLKQKYSAT